MEFTTRLCGSGDEQALSLVAQATILETYAGITDGRDLIQYVTAQLSVADFSTMMASDRVRVWMAETVAGECAVGYAVTVSDEGAKPVSSKKSGFKFTQPTLMPSNSTNALVLSRPGSICFKLAKVLTEF